MKIVICSYTGEDWDVRDEAARTALESEEGQFAISGFCLIEPMIHRRVKKCLTVRRQSATLWFCRMIVRQYVSNEAAE